MAFRYALTYNVLDMVSDIKWAERVEAGPCASLVEAHRAGKARHDELEKSVPKLGAGHQAYHSLKIEPCDSM
jgi:hypothetical protein